MKFKIIHELPDRLRINLMIPKGSPFNMDSINGIKGVVSAFFNIRTGNLLVRHNGDGVVKKEVLKAIEKMSLSLCLKKDISKNKASRLAKKKKAVIAAGARLFISPLLPLQLRIPLSFYGAFPFFRKGLNSLFKKKLDINVLDATAIAASMGMQDYKTAGIIALLLKTGEYLEEWTKDKSRKMLTHAFRVGDEYAWVRMNDSEYMVKASDLKEGDIVVARIGSRIPVDGVVIDGEAMINQASMTGEPFPVLKRRGLTVYAGTAVDEGMIAVKATGVGSETRVARIVKIIEESESLKADIQSHAEQLADRIVPYSFLLSGMTYALTGNPLRAASVLLVDYSCAIKLSTPLAIMSAMMRSANQGALIKGGKFIEKLSKTDVFVLDKTGTLTEAAPNIVDVIHVNDYSRDYVLRLAACLEEHFPHPIATAVVKRAREEGLIHEEEHAEVEYIAAHGIASKVNSMRILVGSRHFVCEDEGIDMKIVEQVERNLAVKGYSALYIAIDNRLAGIIAIDDPIREESYRFIRMLRESGIKRIIMLTGDNEAAAKNAAKSIGIEEFFGEVFPDGKSDILEEIKKEGHTVAMVGDGINDSAALARADVGISMKHGADIAKEACDILLLDSSLLSILEAKKISERAMNTIRQNFKYIVGINSALILLSLGGFSTPAFSALMHNASTVLSALNSIRLASGKGSAAKEDRCKFFEGGAAW